MSQLYKYKINDLNLLFEVDEQEYIRLLHLSTLPYPDVAKLSSARKEASCLVELQVTGMDCPGHKGIKFSNTLPGHCLKFKSIAKSADEIVVIQETKTEALLYVETHFAYFNDINILKIWNKVKNIDDKPWGIEYISSVNIVGLNSAGTDAAYTENILHVPHNTWTGEEQWDSRSVGQRGLLYAIDGEKNQDSTKIISAGSNSGWSCSQFAPHAVLENKEQGVCSFWQVENNGAWHWELSDAAKGRQLALRASGPTELYNHWWKNLQPQECFTTVPAAFGCVNGDFTAAVQELTKYRRAIRRYNEDNIKLPVIFNDYMNCLSGSPTTAKLLPLIEAASKVGCEYFVVDCGWYADGYWWDNVGEWQPSKERFPNGIKEVIDCIRSHGMVAGLWLEIEVMGVKSKLANELPDDWFFVRHGKRIVDNNRYQLDFRNGEVRNYATKVIDRLIKDYGIGYIKMDYNSTGGIGTEIGCDSYGEGLLQHNRAYLHWIDEIFAKYPQLVIENCGSGGMRHDYQMLSRHSIQSVSDQTDYICNGAIAATAASWVTPEQAAVWSYPLRQGDREEVIFNMVNALLLRIHQSGHLAELTPERLAYVKQAIDVYKSLRTDIAAALPVWPSGMPHIGDGWFSFGLQTTAGDIYLAVWRTNSQLAEFCLELPYEPSEIVQLYPQQELAEDTAYTVKRRKLTVRYAKQNMARLYSVKK